MKGLRTQETSKFRKFFKIVQESAKEKGCVFFLEAGDGRDIETSEFEGEDLSGWLVPIDKANEFEPEWLVDDIDEKWLDYFCFAEWEYQDKVVTIEFKFYG